MSIRSELKPYQVITNGAMASGITSLISIIQKISLVTYTYSWSGTAPVGTLAVQVSNDYSIGPTGLMVTAGNWSSVPFLIGTTTALSIPVTGATGTANITLPLVGAYAIQTIYTAASGTGILQAWICGKVS